jgi:hypothetical protein
MNKNLVIAIVLGALVLIAVVQAWQLAGIKSSVASGGVRTASVGTPVASGGGGGGGAQLPSNLQNLPSMVGGC